MSVCVQVQHGMQKEEENKKIQLRLNIVGLIYHLCNSRLALFVSACDMAKRLPVLIWDKDIDN